MLVNVMGVRIRMVVGVVIENIVSTLHSENYEAVCACTRFLRACTGQ